MVRAEPLITRIFAGSEEFQEEWFGVDEHGESLHEIGKRGAWDAKKRDEELSAAQRDAYRDFRDGIAELVERCGPVSLD